MIVDINDLPQGARLQYDLCVIGAGAAGITLARALNGRGLSICLLESGGFDFDERIQTLYEGAVDSHVLETDHYLTASRLRYFGGTTNHWNGMCRPLDALDFTRRDWVPGSGWPITRDDLASCYREAAEVLQFQPYDDSWGEIGGAGPAVLGPGEPFVGRRFRLSPPTRFGMTYRAELTKTSDVVVLLHASAVHLDLNEAGTHVDRVRVASLSGRRLTISAATVVLAAGGVENARLLLASDTVQPHGIGNASDWVGRCFMEHPETVAAQIVLTAPDVLDTFQMLQTEWASLCLTDAAQRRHRVLNAGIQFLGAAPERSAAGGVPLDIGPAVSRIDRPAHERGEGESARTPVYMAALLRIEAAPRRENRVTLDEQERDALGMRRARVAFSMGALESRTVVELVRVLSRTLGARQAGRVMFVHDEAAGAAPLGSPPWHGVIGANHHIGTTRMSDTSQEGVVDRDCRVHGVRNLYVAGSSVFPTSGMANPTFTIVAMTLRLARHLAAKGNQS